MVSVAAIIGKGLILVGDVFLVLIILIRSRFCAIFCNTVTLDCGIIQQFFYFLVNLGAYFSVTVLAGHCSIVACTLYCNGHLHDR